MSLSSEGTKGEFRSDIQGLRAIAVVLVVIFHSGLALPGGYIGVDVFFTLSGFLIIGLLDREVTNTGSIDVPEFFSRRIRRLLPALAIVILVTVLVSIALLELGSPLRSTTRTAVGASASVANLVLYRDLDYFTPDAERNPLLHTWSLSVEEQFYLLIPILLAGLTRALAQPRRSLLSRRRAWIMVLLAGSTVSFLLSVWLVDVGGQLPGLEDSAMLAFYSPFTRAWQFGAGGVMVLWLADRHRTTEDLPNSEIRLAAGLILIAASAVVLDTNSPFPGLRAVLPTLGTLLTLLPNSYASEAAPKGPIRALLSSRAAVAIGNHSYSLYLWHWPALVLMREWVQPTPASVALALGCAVVLSALTFRLVEQPIRRNRAISGMRAVRLAAVCVAGPVVLASGTAMINESVTDSRNVAFDERFSWSRQDCHFDRGEARPWPSTACVRGHGGAETEAVDILVIGDSHADALADGALAAAVQLDRSLGVWTFSGGPPHGDPVRIQRYADLIRSTQPDVLVLTSRSAQYLENVRRGEISAQDLGLSTDGGTLEERWAASLGTAVETYRSLGPQVIWVKAVPEFPAGRRPTLVFRNRGLLQAISAEDLERQRGAVTVAEERVLGAIDGVSFVDPAEALCKPDCVSRRDGILLYRDDNHLSPGGSRTLVELLVGAIADSELAGRAPTP